MRDHIIHFNEMLISAIWKAWLVFCTVAIAMVLLVAVVAPRNLGDLLITPDPYLMTTIFGVFASMFAIVHVAIRYAIKTRRASHIVFAAVVLLWSGFLFVGTQTPIDPVTWPMEYPIGSAIVGLLAWLLTIWRTPHYISITLSCIGVLFFFGWLRVSYVLRSHIDALLFIAIILVVAPLLLSIINLRLKRSPTESNTVSNADQIG